MKTLALLIMTGVSALLIGCEGSSESGDIRTSGLHATVNITAAEDNRSEVSVRLRVGDRHSNTYLELGGGDRLQATLNNSITEEIDIKDGSRYRGSFNSVGAGLENAGYRVSFIRPEDADALNSEVLMPPAISSFSANPSTTFSRSTELLTLSWNATAENHEISLGFSGDCITNISLDANSSTGIYAVNPLTLRSDNSIEENCEITITTEITNSGDLDTAFGEGGVITATRRNSLSLISTP